MGGEMVAYETQLALFFRDTINIARIFDCFHDIRMHPRILLKDILISVFLMPYWGIKALLQRLHLRFQRPVCRVLCSQLHRLA